jgi:hypothetical protein
MKKLIRKLFGIQAVIDEIEYHRYMAKLEYNNNIRIFKKNRKEAKEVLALIEEELAILEKRKAERKGKK